MAFDLIVRDFSDQIDKMPPYRGANAGVIADFRAGDYPTVMV